MASLCCTISPSKAATEANCQEALSSIFFDLENFVKKASELADNQECWLYLLKNSGQLAEKPEVIKGTEFDTFLRAAEVAAYNKNERIQYEKDMVTAQDMKNALAWAEYKGKMEVAKAMLANNVEISVIVKCTGLSKEEIGNSLREPLA